MTSTPRAVAVRHAGPAARATLLAQPPPGMGPDAPLPNASGRLRRILVATDGAAASDGALAVAGALARRDGAVVDVVSVLPRWGPPPPVLEVLTMTDEPLGSRLGHVIPQSQRAMGDGGTRWTATVIDSGSVSATIAEAARTAGHDLIVTGRRRGLVDRWLRRPTALAVAQRSGIPTLAVPQSVTRPPTRAIVAVEGTEADFATARAAVGILAEGADLHLVHVDCADDPAADRPAPGDCGTGWAPRFASLERALDGVGAVTVDKAVLRGGEPAARLVAYAKRTGAELIAVGTRQPATLARHLRSGVSRRILRAAECCVLVCGPGSPGDAA